MEATSVQAKEVFCANPECPALRSGKPRYIGQHVAGCRVPCPKCNRFTDVR